jgi:hypothetical protein
MDHDFEDEQRAAMATLEPHFSQIVDICNSAVALYNSETTPRGRADHDSRAALAAIYSHAWKGYIREFGEEAGFHFLTIRGLNLLNIRDAVVLRAKKVDANGRHTNHASQQQREFDRQLPLPGLSPAATRLVIGYELDPAFSTVERVIVRRPLGQWTAQIVLTEAAYAWEDITPAQLPFNPGRRAVG